MHALPRPGPSRGIWPRAVALARRRAGSLTGSASVAPRLLLQSPSPARCAPSPRSRRAFSSSSFSSLAAAPAPATAHPRPPIILDGSMTTELNPWCNVHARNTRRESLQALLHDPDTVRRIHLDYIRAGANVITTANFSCVPHFLAREAQNADMGALIELSGQLAKQARDQAVAEQVLASSTTASASASASSSSAPAATPPPRPVAIAGCVPPVYDASALFHANQLMPEPEQRRLLELVVARLEPHVDLFLIESLVSISQAELAAEVAMRTTKPVWVSWKLHDSHAGIPCLFSGETLPQAVDRLLNSLPRAVDAYLLNCSTPASIATALPILRKVTQRPIGALVRLPACGPPEAFPPEHAHEHAPASPVAFGHSVSPAADPVADTALASLALSVPAAPPPALSLAAGALSPEAFADVVADWVERFGLDIAGGCCGVGVAHIRALARRLERLRADHDRRDRERALLSQHAAAGRFSAQSSGGAS